MPGSRSGEWNDREEQTIQDRRVLLHLALAVRPWVPGFGIWSLCTTTGFTSSA
jgi:hypothetical protein